GDIPFDALVVLLGKSAIRLRALFARYGRVIGSFDAPFVTFYRGVQSLFERNLIRGQGLIICGCFRDSCKGAEARGLPSLCLSCLVSRLTLIECCPGFDEVVRLSDIGARGRDRQAIQSADLDAIEIKREDLVV